MSIPYRYLSTSVGLNIDQSIHTETCKRSKDDNVHDLSVSSVNMTKQHHKNIYKNKIAHKVIVV